MTAEAAFPHEHRDGRFIRQDSGFRRRVSAASGADFPAAGGRYHLYVSLACPWAHRTIIYRKLKGLEGAISMTVVDPERDERGWRIGETPDAIGGFTFLSDAYAASDEHFVGHVTVPVLWDTKRRLIVNNESSEIIRMLDTQFDAFATRHPGAFAPADRVDEIDELNTFIYDNVNNGVYRCGFATTQSAYDEAFAHLFEALDTLDARLGSTRYLLGDHITEADWRLFPTLVRFDAVYVGHFKCNLRRIADYTNLSGYLRDLYQQPGIAETVDFDHIKRHYYRTHPTINPTRVVPRGPLLDLERDHERG